jgi:hypothetical protein
MGFVLDKSWINQLREQKPESKEITEGVIEGEEAKRIIKQYKSSIVFTQTRDKDGKLTQVFDIDQGLLPARRKILWMQILKYYQHKFLYLGNLPITVKN